jgi:acylphosphatase
VFVVCHCENCLQHRKLLGYTYDCPSLNYKENQVYVSIKPEARNLFIIHSYSKGNDPYLSERELGMVEMVFYIEGTAESIFDVGFRPALVGKASEYGVRLHASNLRKQKKVRVIASGDTDSIREFYEFVENKDIRLLQHKLPDYTVGELKDYEGPGIDWDGYNLQFMSEQLTKGMMAANERLKELERLQELTSINSTLNTLENKFGVIGDTLEEINKRLKDTV